MGVSTSAEVEEGSALHPAGTQSLHPSSDKARGYHNSVLEKENFEKAKLLDFLYCQTIAEKIIEFDKKYNEHHSASEPGEKE